MLADFSEIFCSAIFKKKQFQKFADFYFHTINLSTQKIEISFNSFTAEGPVI